MYFIRDPCYTENMKTDLKALFQGVEKGTIVFLKYRAGRRPTMGAVREAMEAEQYGMEQNEYFGHFDSLNVTKKGDTVLTLFVTNRGANGAYRAFNPSLGTLEDIQILSQ